MTPPGFWHSAALGAFKDLRLEWRTWESSSASLVFSVVVLVIFHFAFDDALDDPAARARLLVPGVIWTVLAFASVVGLAHSFQLERQGDTLGALLIAPIDRSALFLGKLLANLAKMTLVAWAIALVTAVFFAYDLPRVLGPLVLVLFLHTLGLTVLGTLFSAIAMRVGRGEALLATLLLPAATPLYLSAVQCTGALLQGKLLASASGWLGLTLGFDFLYLFLSLWVFELVVEE